MTTNTENDTGSEELGLEVGVRYRFDLVNGFTRWGKIDRMLYDDDGYPFIIHIRAFNQKTGKDELHYTLTWNAIVGYSEECESSSEAFDSGSRERAPRLPAPSRGPSGRSQPR